MFAWVFTYKDDLWSRSDRIIVITADNNVDEARKIFNKKLHTHYSESFIQGLTTNSDFVKATAVKPGLAISDSDMA